MISEEIEYYKESLKEFDIKKQEIINTKKFRFFDFIASSGLSIFRSKNLDRKIVEKKNESIIGHVILLMVFSLIVTFVFSLISLVSENKFGFELLYMFISFTIYILISLYSFNEIEEKALHKKIKINNRKNILKIKKSIKNDYSNINILENIIYYKDKSNFLETQKEILYYAKNKIQKKDNEKLFNSLKAKIYSCLKEGMINFNELSLTINQYLDELNIENEEILSQTKLELKEFLKGLEDIKSLKDEIKEFSNIQNDKTLNNINEINKVKF